MSKRKYRDRYYTYERMISDACRRLNTLKTEVEKVAWKFGDIDESAVSELDELCDAIDDTAAELAKNLADKEWCRSRNLNITG